MATVKLDSDMVAKIAACEARAAALSAVGSCIQHVNMKLHVASDGSLYMFPVVSDWTEECVLSSWVNGKRL